MKLQIACYQNENYQAIALQIQLKILKVALNKQIKVFKLNDLAFTQQQVLNNHSRNVSILLFFQSVNSFISGSLDKSLNIWTWDEIGQIYQCNQIINNSVEQKFILINKQENLIISGGKNQISFWMSQSSKWLLQQKLGFDKIQIFGLNFSLNQQLIATYTSNHKIVLIKKQNNKTQNYWFISLQINVNDFTPSFCFISDFIILYQSIKDASLRLIKINQDSDQIQYQTKILINKVCDEQTTFPMQFNQQKKISNELNWFISQFNFNNLRKLNFISQRNSFQKQQSFRLTEC
ncbi:unnamed protein product [Paramecium pentaurelia]|uniref:Uncharacterized protein n=1 Tax=Paramecium pentaurelia TaxID=43138 RepID=A0A8S1XYI4_9CILI|nr:unnamed protein product [Paramecium pentaurelia]